MKTETILFDTVVPCPAPVHLADLLTEIETVIKNHVILSDHAAAALAVWVLHTYTFELRDTVAYVAIESPEKRCGKTTLLSVLAAMAHRPLISSNITVGALFRAIHNCSPTLFADEADKRYVSEADAKARVLEIQRRWQLQEEVSVQVKKETELRQKLMALAEKEKKLGPEAWAILDQLNNMQKMDGSASPRPTEDKKENNIPASDVAIPTGL